MTTGWNAFWDHLLSDGCLVLFAHLFIFDSAHLRYNTAFVSAGTAQQAADHTPLLQVASRQSMVADSNNHRSKS